MKKLEFMEAMDYAIEKNTGEERVWAAGYSVAVTVDLPELKEPEIIINPPSNLESKKAYYDKAYDDEMRLRANPEVQITDIEAVGFMSDLNVYIHETFSESPEDDLQSAY